MTAKLAPMKLKRMEYILLSRKDLEKAIKTYLNREWGSEEVHDKVSVFYLRADLKAQVVWDDTDNWWEWLPHLRDVGALENGPYLFFK